MLCFESAVHFHRRPHTILDVVPLDAHQQVDAVMSFREAFVSAGEEWAQHKKLIDITPERPLTRAVPRHFPYLYAEWEENVGVVHPVETKGAESEGSEIGSSFCYDVAASILGEDEHRLRKHSNLKEDKSRITRFKQFFAQYDWTQY